MNKFFVTFIVGWSLVAMLIFFALTRKTEYGPCVGILDDKDPTLKYKVSVLNVTLSALTVHLVFPMVVTLVDATFCPVAKKDVADAQ